MDANTDDDDDLDFLDEGYVKDNSSNKAIMIKREAGKRLQVINHHQMEGTTAAADHEKKKASNSNNNNNNNNNIGGRKGLSSGGSGSTGSAGSMKCCQADKCTAELTDAKQYHRRHKVCEYHSKAQVVIVGGIRQRFCQQCSRFHEVSEFDESKRSCRRRLAGHNERRRKSTVAETTQAAAEGSGGRGKGHTKEMVDDRGRIQISIQENSSTNFKHFQI